MSDDSVISVNCGTVALKTSSMPVWIMAAIIVDRTKRVLLEENRTAAPHRNNVQLFTSDVPSKE